MTIVSSKEAYTRLIESIRLLRASKRLSQSEFADRIGMTEGKFCKTENFKRNLTVVELFAICEVFNVKIVDLLSEVENG